MAEPGVIIIGAGPAGVRAAEELVAAGVRPTLIDEGRRDGGQIYRRQPDHFKRKYATLYGSEAMRAADLHRSFEALRSHINYRLETMAWNISEGHVHMVNGHRSRKLPYSALIVCSGATDRLMPVTGWELPGTYSLGAAQIALKSQACAVGSRVVFMGSGPLLYLVAYQYMKAGAGVAAVLDNSRFWNRLTALPKLLARPALLRLGMGYVSALRKAGVPVIGGIEPVEIRGDSEDGVRAVRFRTGGEVNEIDCDAVAIGYHLRPETQLADLARCAFRFDAATRQWFPDVTMEGRSSVPGVYLAGDGARILGAEGAENAGRLAALSLLKDMGRNVDENRVQTLLAAQDKMERFRQGLVEAFPWPAEQAGKLSDDAIVCRCECITAGELRRVVKEMGAHEANRAKAFSRVGMGRCQGRYCGHAGAEIIAHACGVPLEQVGRLRSQAPVKPLSIAVREELE
ncbi:FAD-dependent oxidoreductase [Pseudoduganella sp. UC29_106]|uniref:FAD/NAD(P)-dependent oxidoreductase n=1 Tax=Pseudoduganella sp. UC29_106 TaxID=3374553 RepID=UPI0037581CF8